MDTIITGDDDETAAAEIETHALQVGWGGVRPETQVRVRWRAHMRDAVVQRRGAFWFAWSDATERAVGPMPSRKAAAEAAIADA